MRKWSSNILHISSEYYRLICIVFLSPFNSPLVQEAKESIKEAQANRPETEKELNKIINGAKIEEDNESENEESDKESDNESESDGDSEIEIKKKSEKENTIKARSPFTKHFKEIKEKVISEIKQQSNNDLEINDLHKPRVIDDVYDGKYIPYSYLWSAFTSRGMGLTRITNGCLESYNGFKKKKAIKNRLPHRYIQDSYETTNVRTIEYLATIQHKTLIKRKIDPVFEYEGDNKHKCTENYDKRRKKFLISN